MDFSKEALPDKIQCKNDLHLKSVSLEDAESFLKIIVDNQNYFSQFEFIAPTFKTLQEVQDVIQSLCIHKKNYAGASYGLWKNESLLGLFTINKIDWNNRIADIGFWLGENFSGQGIAYSALQSLIECCSNIIKLKSLTAHTAIGNLKTQNLLEKSGFKKKDLLKNHINVHGESVDEFLYTLIILK